MYLGSSVASQNQKDATTFDGKNEEEAVGLAAAKYLLHSNLLESPVLPVAVLSGFTNQRQSIFESLQTFLKDYRGEKQQQADKDPAKAMKTFHLRTPLNDLLERKRPLFFLSFFLFFSFLFFSFLFFSFCFLRNLCPP